jgi:hypothetical protein
VIFGFTMKKSSKYQIFSPVKIFCCPVLSTVS